MTGRPAGLTLADVEDLREYERHRDDVRREIIELKRRRRVALGPMISMVFENARTIWFQVQEMARAERMTSDAAVQAELDTYNPLVPAPGELSATLFLEITETSQLQEWLPKLVGVERSAEIRLPESTVVRSEAEASHAAALTRENATASVHYVRFSLSGPQIEGFAGGPVSLAINHPSYQATTELAGETRASLLADLTGRG